MTQSHYSLRWNNHQNHILAAFDALLQAETLVDVSLVCAERSVRAHKVVLSACSPFFQKIFSENPCTHPVVVLKDFNGWEIQAIVDFMYKGEISIMQDQIQSLIKAAESLHVRGLANQDLSGADKESSSVTNQTPTPSTSPNDYDRNYFNSGSRHSTPGATARPATDRTSPFSPLPPSTSEHHVNLPHMPRLALPDNYLPRQECHSPIPRRKQARPRRRSGEICGAQDLSTSVMKESSNEETAQNLCIKKPAKEEKSFIKEEEMERQRTPEVSSVSPELDLSMQSTKDFMPSPVNVHPAMNFKQEMDHSQINFPPMPSVSALTMTTPHNNFFGLDSPLALFPSAMENCRSPLFDLPDHRPQPEPQVYKRKMGRPKGQHSAPRGGPPRSWTNQELTQALAQVWNKKMTTSQASRVFGIPYNSLLMYVRGKYGKSLKLEQLRKDCIGGPNPPRDLMNKSGAANNNTVCISDREPEHIQQNTRPPSTEEQQRLQSPIFNPFAPNFYSDFAASFPLPVSMIRLLPQSDRNNGNHSLSEADSRDRMKDVDEDHEMIQVEERNDMVQQNGQD